MHLEQQRHCLAPWKRKPEVGRWVHVMCMVIRDELENPLASLDFTMILHVTLEHATGRLQKADMEQA